MSLFQAKLEKSHRGNLCTVSSTVSFADAPVLFYCNSIFFCSINHPMHFFILCKNVSRWSSREMIYLKAVSYVVVLQNLIKKEKFPCLSCVKLSEIKIEISFKLSTFWPKYLSRGGLKHPFEKKQCDRALQLHRCVCEETSTVTW